MTDQHLIDAARLEGIRLGLVAAHKAADAYDNLAAKAIQRLDPDTIACEAVLDQLTNEAQADNMGYKMTDPIDLTPEELLRFQEIMKAWHKVWDEGTTDKPLFDIPQETQHD